MNRTPYPHQVEYRKAIRKGRADGFKRQLVVAPMGAGKTDIFCAETEDAVKEFQSVLILVDQNELVWQPFERLKKLCDITAQIEKAEWKAHVGAEVVIASVQSMVRRLGKWPRNAFQLVIADEADKSLAASWQKCLKHFDQEAQVLGFTGTPKRSDQRNLGEYYDNLIEIETLQSLIVKGFLAPLKIQMFPVNIDLSELRVKGGDFDERELDEAITPHLQELARAVDELAPFRRTLVFLPLVKTCAKFAEVARDIGMSCDYVFGEDPERENKQLRFERGEIDVIANSQVWGRGIDLPFVDALGMFRPTRSVALYQQEVGRGTRLFPGKADCLLLDPLYMAGKRLTCSPAHLVAKTEEEAEAIADCMEAAGSGKGFSPEQLDLMEIVGSTSSQREAALKKRLEANKHKQAQTISAEEFAMSHKRMDLAEFEPTMAWESKPVTDRQAKYLNQAGIALDSVKGTAHASKLLNVYFANKPLKLASHSVRAKMRQMKHPNWEHATEQEGRQFFAGLNAKRKQPELV